MYPSLRNLHQMTILNPRHLPGFCPMKTRYDLSLKALISALGLADIKHKSVWSPVRLINTARCRLKLPRYTGKDIDIGMRETAADLILYVGDQEKLKFNKKKFS